MHLRDLRARRPPPLLHTRERLAAILAACRDDVSALTSQARATARVAGTCVRSLPSPGACSRAGLAHVLPSPAACSPGILATQLLPLQLTMTTRLVRSSACARRPTCRAHRGRALTRTRAPSRARRGGQARAARRPRRRDGQQDGGRAKTDKTAAGGLAHAQDWRARRHGVSRVSRPSGCMERARPRSRQISRMRHVARSY